MGTVYLAREGTLDRLVIIKVINERLAREPDAASRFLREARAMASVEHPHVVRVYAYGQIAGRPYLVMEWIDGETLAGRIQRLRGLPVAEALDFTLQIVDGLSAAWEQKLVHRDVKPSNVLIDSKNQARVADFGLAKPIDVEDRTALTFQGTVLGTPHYVSPEQARGEAVDCRSDMYSLGVVLYEMLTGERPFKGTSPISIIDQQLNAPLPSLRTQRPDVPAAVEHLVIWLTQKDPSLRPTTYLQLQQAVEALADPERSSRAAAATLIPRFQRRGWHWPAAAAAAVAIIALGSWAAMNRDEPAAVTASTPRPAPHLPAVAVLPFRNVTGDATQDFFGVGLADVITSRLAPSREIVVRPMGTVLTMQGSDRRKAASALGVDYIVDGLVQRSGTTLRISVTLYNVKTDGVAWSDEIRARETEVFALQDRIALPLAAALEVKVGGDGGLRATAMTTQSSDAYFTYLQGRDKLLRFHGGDPSDANLRAAADFFTAAMRRDGSFAAPKFSLAATKLLRLDSGYNLDPRELGRSIELAQEAIRLDGTLGEAHASLAFAFVKGNRPDEAFEALSQALRLEPNNETVRIQLGIFLNGIGLWDELLQQCAVIARLNPSNTFAVVEPARLHIALGEYAEAASAFRAVAARTADPILLGYLAVAEAGAGNAGEARRIIGIADVHPLFKALASAMIGDATASRRWLTGDLLRFGEADALVAHDLAATYARLGDTERAIDWVRKAIAQGQIAHPAYASDPSFNSLRNDARFTTMLTELEARWRAARIRYRLPPELVVPVAPQAPGLTPAVKAE
jgi:serine/threonine-protein kinase